MSFIVTFCFIFFFFPNPICWTLCGNLVISVSLVCSSEPLCSLHYGSSLQHWSFLGAILTLQRHAQKQDLSFRSQTKVSNKPAAMEANCLLSNSTFIRSPLSLHCQQQLLCSDMPLPLEYLFAAPFLCVLRAYSSMKAQNYLCLLWINLISNHIKKKACREFYWNKVLVFVW